MLTEYQDQESPVQRQVLIKRRELKPQGEIRVFEVFEPQTSRICTYKVGPSDFPHLRRNKKVLEALENKQLAGKGFPEIIALNET
jgi:hypothetical protein